MNIIKNMEAVVIAALALTFVSAVASARVPHKPAPVATVADSVTTIVVTGKRLNPEQKAAFAG